MMKRQISGVQPRVRMYEIIRRCYMEIKCNCYVNCPARVTVAEYVGITHERTNNAVSAERDVKTALHYAALHPLYIITPKSF